MEYFEQPNKRNDVRYATYLYFGILMQAFRKYLIMQHQIESEEYNSLDGHAQQIAAEIIPFKNATMIIDSYNEYEHGRNKRKEFW